MTTPDASQTGRRLDDHHQPETNGRMCVCRRCGSQTDAPVGGHHLPTERQLVRSGEWLTDQSRIQQMDRIRRARGG